jgi:hypothetical protein
MTQETPKQVTINVSEDAAEWIMYLREQSHSERFADIHKCTDTILQYIDDLEPIVLHEVLLVLHNYYYLKTIVSSGERW